MKARILAFEPAPLEAERLKSLLILPEFVLRAETRLDRALAAAINWQPELALVSESVPSHAADLLAGLKLDPRTAAVPVFWLAASEAAGLKALRGGAVSYLLKPYEPEELLARARALARHYRASASGDGSLRFGPLVLDRPGRRVYVAGRPLELSPKEFETLEYLAESAGRVLTRRQILERVWGFDSSSGPRVVDYHVFQLRRKLGPRLTDAIDTVSRVGYCFRPEAVR